MTQTDKRIAIAAATGLDYDWWTDTNLARASAVELLEALRREYGLYSISSPERDQWSITLSEDGMEYVSECVFAPTFPAAAAEAYGRARNLWGE